MKYKNYPLPGQALKRIGELKTDKKYRKKKFNFMPY
jgi:hypothetical protein